MDFFSHQENARRRSRSLVWRFIFANIILAALLSVSVLSVVAYSSKGSSPQAVRAEMISALPAVGFLDLVVVLTVFIAALFQFRALSSSGGAVAERLGGRKVSPETSDLLERRYRNVVEEMALAANCPVPEVYVLADEEGINAFASGPTPENSAVAVTRGALERLTRDELQGVVAHEFSHIVHGDVRLNIRLAAYIAGLVCLSALGELLLRLVSRSDSGSRRSKDDKSGAFIGVLIIAVFFLLMGIFGRLLSVLMSAAISREREFLADATAVQLTRNPDGIAGALKKIGGFQAGSQVQSPAAKGLAHFFLASAGKPSFFDRLLASHPPLEERVKRIEPSFAGKFPESDSIEVQSAQEVAALSGLTSGASGHREDASPDKVKDAVAHGLPLHAGWAPPASLHSDVVAIGGAEAIVIATLLSLQEKVSSSQRSLAQKWAPLKDLDRLQAELEKLSLNQRISVIFLAMPSIREGAVSRRKAFLRSIEEIIVEDRQVTLAEFLVAVLVRFATKDKDGTFTLRGGPVDSSLASHGSDIGRVLSVCAHFSSDDVANREALFAAAISRLNLTSSFIADAGTSVPQFMTSLDVIRGMPPLLRGEVMRACEELVTADGVVTENEAVIMRLMAVLLRTELPASVEPEAQT